jgi:sulfate transport system permease protein
MTVPATSTQVPLAPAARPTALAAPRARGQWRRRLLIGLVWAYVALLILAPLAALIRGAFAQGLGVALAALRQPDVQLAFLRTIQIALVVLVVHAVFCTIVAWVLVRHRFPGRRLISALVDLPFAVSAVVVGYMLLLLFGRNGVLGPWLDQLGFRVAFAVPGMLLATLFVTLPFMIRELMPLLEALGREPEQAAATLGASAWQTFWLVTFPALRWGFLYGLALTLARALGEFGAVLVIGGGIQRRTETATVFIFRALDDRKYLAAYSVALVLGLISLLLVSGIDLLRRRQETG